MEVKRFNANDSKDLTLRILSYLAFVGKKNYIPTKIKRVDDPEHLYSYEITLIKQEATSGLMSLEEVEESLLNMFP